MLDRRIFLALAALNLALGCRDKEVEVYRTAKETAVSRPVDAPPAPPPAGALRWTLPEGWHEQPGSGMRLATIIIPSAGAKPLELAVTSLDGDAGGELANVNRWRGQVGLEPIDDKALSGQAERIKSVAGTLLWVDLIGEGASGEKPRMLAAILPYNGKTWFFKAAGPEAELGKAKPSLRRFLESLR